MGRRRGQVGFGQQGVVSDYVIDLNENIVMKSIGFYDENIP